MLLEGQTSYRPQVKLKSSCQLQLLVMSNVKGFTGFAYHASSSAHILPLSAGFLL